MAKYLFYKPDLNQYKTFNKIPVHQIYIFLAPTLRKLNTLYCCKMSKENQNTELLHQNNNIKMITARVTSSFHWMFFLQAAHPGDNDMNELA